MTRRQSDYFILERDNIGDLEEMVELELKSGSILVGGPIIHSVAGKTKYAQAVLFEYEEKDEDDN